MYRRRKQRNNIINLILVIFMLLVFLCGLFTFLFPFIWGAAVDREIYGDALDFLTREETTTASPPLMLQQEPTEPTLAYQELWDAMISYNQGIFEEGQSGLTSELDYQRPSFILADYGLNSEIFGVINIPVMELSMPIYLGATESNMAFGAAHMSQTSLPIGGENTNCVISGHRGYNGASYFRFIEKLSVGDFVYITNLWEDLSYRVCEIEIIEPYEFEKILIQEGRDMLTLVTCHPYASGGRQRYVVYCERVP